MPRQVSDNSGAKLVQCIQKSGTQWTIGDIITVAVKKARGGKVCCCGVP
jgi:ribosomal protein L14